MLFKHKNQTEKSREMVDVGETGEFPDLYMLKYVLHLNNRLFLDNKPDNHI